MDPFLGQISIVGFNFAPRGWAACDGQLLPINQNQALFSLLGTQFGGDGRTNFALPDLRGRAAFGPDGPQQIGQRVGVEAVALSAQQLPSHEHALHASTDLADAAAPAGALPAGRARGGPLLYAAAGAGDRVAMSGGAIAAAGANAPHTNMQPFLALNFVIALQGVFPSRD